MKITAVGAEYFLRLSTGNYGSEEFRCGVQARLDDEDSVAEVFEELAGLVRAQVRHELEKSRFRAVRQAVTHVQPDLEDESPF